MDHEGEDRAYEVIASALAGGPHAPPPEDGTSGSKEPEQVEVAPTTGAPVAPRHPFGGLSDLPGRVRARVGALLGEGEIVECVLEGHKKRGSRFLVATTHRILVLERTDGSRDMEITTFPYHRTDPLTTTDRELTLEYREFGNARVATIELREGRPLEVSHILDRLATA